MRRSFFARFGGPVVIAIVAVAVASCGGGGGVRSTPQPAPSASASAATSATASVAVPAAGGTVSLPTVASFASTLSFGTVPSGTTLTTTVSTTAPSGTPATSTHRKITSGIAGGVAFFYITFTTSQGLSAAQLTGESVTVPSSVPSGASIYAELDDITSIASPVDIADFGPATIANGSATITNTAPGGVTLPTLSTTDTYLIQFYYVAAAGSSPSPSGSPSPTASSSPSGSPSPTASSSPSGSPSPTASSSPSGSPSPTASSSPSSSPSPTASPSPSSSGGNSSLPDYGFTGPSDSTGSFTPPSAPAALFLPSTGTYGTYGITASVQFDYTGGYASSPASTTSNLTLTLGSSSADITSPSFPYFTPTASAHPLFYGELKNTGVAHFNDFPNVVITATTSTLPSTSCSFYVYSNNGSPTPSWNMIVGPVTATGTANNTSVIQFQPQVIQNGTVDITNASPNYLMVAC